AYVSPEGHNLNWVGFGDPEKYKDRFALRDRTLTITIPAARLQQGRNVLAVEVHRAPAAEVMFAGKFNHEPHYAQWAQIALKETILTAPSISGVVVASSRPKGFQVWNEPLLPGLRVTDWGESGISLRPLRVCGCLNGAFSAQFVVACDEAIRGLRVTATGLQCTNNRDIIPARQIQIRYASPGLQPEMDTDKFWTRFEGLLEEAPVEVPFDTTAGGAVQPVWVTVQIPKTLKAGRYDGAIEVAAQGLVQTRIPLMVDVADWTLPDPRNYGTVMGFVQSPESLALQYGVEMWSPDHWKLIERSFEWLGRIGTKDLYIPLRARTYFGNEHSMVRWVGKRGTGDRTGQEPAYDLDFSIVEKYVDTAIKHLGQVPAVVAYVWDVDSGSVYMDGKSHRVAMAAFPFTVRDPVTGELENREGPKWGEPAMREFLRPVFEGLMKILAARKLEGSLMVGICGDRRPEKEVVDDLRAVVPQAPWVMSSHSYSQTIHGQPLGLHTLVWGLSPAPDPAQKRVYGWQNPEMQLVHPRYGSSVLGQEMTFRAAFGVYRTAAEMALTAGGLARAGQRGLRGIGRCGADFWPVIESKGKKTFVAGRYPETAGWHGGNIVGESYPYILWPGRTGPVATIRYELLREGVQEAEARIFLEKVLTTPNLRATIGEELAGRCQALLDERVRANRRAIQHGVPTCAGGNYLSWVWFAGSGWEERSRRLYELAAEVGAALAARGI
ncbi:MAG: DUF4091 domain-containing protein, partial [Kiritimatiellae bacterium]|nr:DUF4091 domain-containing protein [Kiritimatiellia bacterium]